MSAARKKVIVRRLSGVSLAGYLPSRGFVRTRPGHASDHIIDLLDLTGRVQELDLRGVRMISFVRDFNLGDTVNPERLLRRVFLSRPRNEGTWIRLTFRPFEELTDRTPDVLEGLAAADLAFVDCLLEDHGLLMVPPDTRSNTQHIFVPRSAIESLQILAVITSPSRARSAPVRTPEQIRKELQDSLFDVPTPPGNRPN